MNMVKTSAFEIIYAENTEHKFGKESKRGEIRYPGKISGREEKMQIGEFLKEERECWVLEKFGNETKWKKVGTPRKPKLSTEKLMQLSLGKTRVREKLKRMIWL